MIAIKKLEGDFPVHQFSYIMIRCPSKVFDSRLVKAEYHLGGPTCDPPLNKLLAGFDPVAVAALLGYDWRGIEYIRLADGVLGTAQ